MEAVVAVDAVRVGRSARTFTRVQIGKHVRTKCLPGRRAKPLAGCPPISSLRSVKLLRIA